MIYSIHEAHHKWVKNKQLQDLWKGLSVRTTLQRGVRLIQPHIKLGPMPNGLEVNKKSQAVKFIET